MFALYVMIDAYRRGSLGGEGEPDLQEPEQPAFGEGKYRHIP